MQFVVEHHLKGQELNDGCKYLKDRGWRCFGSQAEQSVPTDGGTHGGTMVATKADLDSKPVAGSKPAVSGWRCLPETAFASGAQLTLGHRQILALGVTTKGLGH